MRESGPVISLELDTVGRRCPVPVLELARHITDVAPGELLAVVSDDEAAASDVPAWCRMRGHTYVGAEARPAGTAYVVRRATAGQRLSRGR